MRAVLQRVKHGRVTIEGNVNAEIGQGFVILLGIGPTDTEENLLAAARKIALMRVFEDDQRKMNRSILDIGGSAVVVSQFTLYADTRKGNRPSFTDAAPPALASALVDKFVQFLRDQGVPTQTGIFGADMLVDISNDGPVTIILRDD
ncbi:MAG: D-tyrosyl-tRNA(Tyr) deacylase [Chloroflexi bacterium]|jgi:D-tyrosyl-tRNA(Tyr) deacylase|nr:D-tyrosyl-tRNA(Tyr) deacylase [Chloroflexota bacterium]BCY18254.1 D-aminoacyl-tRNA deacylase [Leptolinea sp. HRD-7]